MFITAMLCQKDSVCTVYLGLYSSCAVTLNYCLECVAYNTAWQTCRL